MRRTLDQQQAIDGECSTRTEGISPIA